MKLAREVYPEKVTEVIDLFKKELPTEISFTRIAFIGYETQEKDILWQKRLV